MNLTIAQFNSHLESYTTYLAVEKNLSPKSIHAYQYDLSLFVRWCQATESHNVSAEGIASYFGHLHNEAGLKDTSIKRKYLSLQSFYKFLIYKNQITSSPIEGLGRNFKKAKRIPKTLSIEDVHKLLLAPQNDFARLKSDFRKRICIRNNAIIELLFSTGIRIGELVGIQLKDINLESQTLLIFGKGRKERILYLSSQEVLSGIKQWLAVRPLFQPNCEALFLNKYGDQLTIYSIEDIFYKYRDAAKINNKATPHYLRHTFATQLLDNGADLRSVQEILGHSSVSTTEIYTEVSVQRKKEVLSRYNPRNGLTLK
ncbi:tyrosine-type recombinase/integrase [Paenibacillus sp. CAU 1782]